MNRKPITINGRTYRGVESMCLDDELRRAFEEYAEWKRREAAEAKRKRDAKARAEAACQRDHGTSCAGVGFQVLGGLLGAGLQAATGGSGASPSASANASNFEATYELVCRERVLTDIDTFKRAFPQSCKGEIWKCEESYSNALKARFGSLSKACASQFGPSYTYESVDNKY